ncbi:hypothetical protein [Kocuria rosea]|uniref:hypothetical protein n=1 Tax=Kocuria rosea TaxID=1275 RepID=UPI002541DA96|nr:hypothetical protein [Kocuria rosea]WIG17182.1 hypothetical protein QOY29_16245 [Kocuria rosea]
MSIEDERRTRAAARATHEPQPRRRTPHDRGARETGLERALDEVRKVGVEASELLRREGLKPAKLVHVPHGARSYPLVGHAFSRVACGYGWHVIRGLVVGTDGRLWTRTPLHDPTPQKDLDAWRLDVEPPGGRGELPHPMQYDGISLHTVRRLSEHEYLKVDLIDHLTDGYARLLVLHHRRRS